MDLDLGLRSVPRFQIQYFPPQSNILDNCIHCPECKGGQMNLLVLTKLEPGKKDPSTVKCQPLYIVDFFLGNK
jgi:hypothetical protein